MDVIYIRLIKLICEPLNTADNLTAKNFTVKTRNFIRDKNFCSVEWGNALMRQ